MKKEFWEKLEKIVLLVMYYYIMNDRLKKNGW